VQAANTDTSLDKHSSLLYQDLNMPIK